MRQEKERGEDKKKEKKKKMEDQLEESFFSNFLLLGRNQCLTAQVGGKLFAWREEIIPIFLGQTVNLNCKAAIWLRTFHQTTG